MKDGDAVLIAWFALAVLWDIIVFSVTTYLVFWCGESIQSSRQAFWR